MKSQNVIASIVGGLALALVVPLTGCNDHNAAPSDSTPTTSATTNTTNPGDTNADNSGKNVRDRNNATLTPGDQGNSDADVQLTQKIRRAVVSSTNDYSMTAKNIKIITVNGKVTLRGPVNNDGEKTGIESIAKSVAGDGNVDDQLEVKANP
jgi:hypothetical protein